MDDLSYLNQPIVIDNGSSEIRSGFCGDELPKYAVPNCVGRVKHQKVIQGSLDGTVFVGKKVLDHKGIMKIAYPIENGIIKNWADMELIWMSVFSKDALNARSEEHPILLTDAPLNPLKCREKSAEILFENFSVPSLYIMSQSVLSLYCTGKATGVVLECGDGVCCVSPIYEGFSIAQSVVRSHVAGRKITEYFRLLLWREGYHFNTSSEMEVVKTMKEKLCCLSPQLWKHESMNERLKYSLPDGHVIEVGSAAWVAAELLFNPEMIGEEYLSTSQMLVTAIQKCDVSLRKTLFENIYLSGGTTLTRGFGERLMNEVKQISSRNSKIKIFSPSDRINAAWLGGSIFASLDIFKRMSISRAEWEEQGLQSLVKKLM